MTKHLFTIAILLCCIQLHAQSWQWANQAGTGGYHDYATVTATDAGGNVYVAGNFSGVTITFGGTILNNSKTGGGTEDIFVVKYDPTGSVSWAKKIGGTKDDVVNGISIDMSDNVVITGSFLSTVITFSTTPPLSLSVTTLDKSDIYVAKIDPAGTILWAKKGIGTEDDNAIGVCTDGLGNVIIAGSFNSPTMAFGPTAITRAGTVDVLVAKFDANGNYLWAQHSSGTGGNGEAYGVAADTGGNIIVTGVFHSSSISFGTNVIGNAGVSDIFIAKYGVTGIAFWAKSAGGTDEDQPLGICTDIAGNAFITGSFLSNAITFGAIAPISNTNVATNDIFVAKYDAVGNVSWAKGTGGPSNDAGTSITGDAIGNVYIAGYFRNSVTFGSTTLTSNGNDDIFIARYSSSGNAGYAKSAGGSGSDAALGISVDIYNNAYLAGGFLSNTFSLGGTTLTNSDMGDTLADMFVTKLNSVNAIDDSQAPDLISIFPNPSSGQFTINLPAGSTNLQISDAIGNIIQSKNIKGETNSVFEIMENGVYLIKLFSDKQVVTQKLIVSN